LVIVDQNLHPFKGEERPPLSQPPFESSGNIGTGMPTPTGLHSELSQKELAFVIYVTI